MHGKDALCKNDIFLDKKIKLACDRGVVVVVFTAEDTWYNVIL